MLPADELAALSRIRITINRYRHQTGDPQALVNNQHLAAYLKRHLARPDWAVWQDLPAEQRVSLVTDQEEQRVRHAFNLLIKQYKRVGYESCQFWQQAQTKPDVDH